MSHEHNPHEQHHANASEEKAEAPTCHDPAIPPKADSNNGMYFAVLAFMALVGLSVGYTFIISGPSDVLQPVGTATAVPDAQTVDVKLQGFKYSPDPVQVKAGAPIRLTMTRLDEEGCANSVVFYSLGKSAALPKGQPVTFDLPAMQSGQTLDFGCPMRMAVGKIVAA